MPCVTAFKLGSSSASFSSQQPSSRNGREKRTSPLAFPLLAAKDSSTRIHGSAALLR